MSFFWWLWRPDQRRLRDSAVAFMFKKVAEIDIVWKPKNAGLFTPTEERDNQLSYGLKTYSDPSRFLQKDIAEWNIRWKRNSWNTSGSWTSPRTRRMEHQSLAWRGGRFWDVDLWFTLLVLNAIPNLYWKNVPGHGDFLAFRSDGTFLSFRINLINVLQIKYRTKHQVRMRLLEHRLNKRPKKQQDNNIEDLKHF